MALSHHGPLRSLFDLQPPGEGVAKLIAQVGDLIGRHRIGIGFQQRLERVIDQLNRSYALTATLLIR